MKRGDMFAGISLHQLDNSRRRVLEPRHGLRERCQPLRLPTLAATCLSSKARSFIRFLRCSRPMFHTRCCHGRLMENHAAWIPTSVRAVTASMECAAIAPVGVAQHRTARLVARRQVPQPMESVDPLRVDRSAGNRKGAVIKPRSVTVYRTYAQSIRFKLRGRCAGLRPVPAILKKDVQAIHLLVLTTALLRPGPFAARAPVSVMSRRFATDHPSLARSMRSRTSGILAEAQRASAT